MTKKLTQPRDPDSDFPYVLVVPHPTPVPNPPQSYCLAPAPMGIHVKHTVHPTPASRAMALSVTLPSLPCYNTARTVLSITTRTRSLCRLGLAPTCSEPMGEPSIPSPPPPETPLHPHLCCSQPLTRPHHAHYHHEQLFLSPAIPDSAHTRNTPPLLQPRPPTSIPQTNVSHHHLPDQVTEAHKDVLKHFIDLTLLGPRHQPMQSVGEQDWHRTARGGLSQGPGNGH